MPAALPDNVDAWRMVQARREFDGTLPLAKLPRLGASLAGQEGSVRYAIEFGTDDFGIAFLELDVEAALPLVCQRTLDVFEQPVRIHQRLGLIDDESREASLPEGYEPLLVTDGNLDLKDVIEDELILSLPVVALAPGVPFDEVPLAVAPAIEVDEAPSNPFAVLGRLRDTRTD
ncbi:YceD family protein [Dokdonella sp. MW10]|uniref:YceD family protein n=1 Tax=Dokdonella sp. MW10 TaxID=2992926 RepID=UPI003F7E8001